MVKKTFTSKGEKFSLFFKDSPDWITQISVIHRQMNELEVTQYLLCNLKLGMTFLDVGAAVGWFTLIGAHEVGAKGQVWAYEPEPSRFELLKENVKLNDYENVRCFPLALSDKDGEAYIGGPGMMRLTEKRTDTPIKTVRLDSHLRGLELRRVDIVKIDVEGAELRVLHGMRETVEKNPGIKIVCEIHSKQMLRYGDNRERLFEFISGLGLHALRIGGDPPHWVFSYEGD
mgnify:CR=1 FL=1